MKKTLPKPKPEKLSNKPMPFEEFVRRIMRVKPNELKPKKA